MRYRYIKYIVHTYFSTADESRPGVHDFFHGLSSCVSLGRNVSRVDRRIRNAWPQRIYGSAYFVLVMRVTRSSFRFFRDHLWKSIFVHTHTRTHTERVDFQFTCRYIYCIYYIYFWQIYEYCHLFKKLISSILFSKIFY